MTTDAIIEHTHAADCKNCGATTKGNFCHQCGQATHLHVPSAREFLHEFIAHYVAIEGKLWNSLKLLLFKPGFLTREFIEGRRVRYVEPLRLYLTFSIIFFAVAKMSGAQLINVDEKEDTPPAASAPAARTETPAPPVVEEKEKEKEKQDEVRDSSDTLGELQGISPELAKRIDRLLKMPVAQREEFVKRTFYSYAPYAIFLMMPVFALYLKVLYLGSGRRYGEHFLFALHSNAFAFLMLSLFVVADGWNFLRFLLLVWLTFYLPTALRRVYGGSRTMTALRWMVLMVLHGVTLGIALLCALSMVLL